MLILIGFYSPFPLNPLKQFAGRFCLHGFFDKIFGKQEKHVALTIAELDAFLEKQALPERQELSRIIAARFAEIKHSLRKIENAVKQLEKSDFSSDNPRLSGIVKTSRQNMIRQLSTLVERLLPPGSMEIKPALSYSNDALVLLQREGQFFGKNIAYTSIYFKEEVKVVGEQLRELIESISSLKKEIESRRKIFATEKILQAKQELLQQQLQKAETKQQLASLKAGVVHLEKQAKALSESMQALQSSEEFRKLAELQEKKTQLQKKKDAQKSETLAFFSSIDKPLRRFASLVKTKKAFLKNSEQESLLSLMLDDAITAIKKDPKGESIKEILSETKKSIETGTISLKEKEKAKRLESIDLLLSKNFFDSFFWKMNEIDAAINEIDRKLSMEQLSKTISRQKEQLKETEQQLTRTRIEILQKEAEHAKKKQLIEAIRQKIEGMAAESSSTKISLSTE